LTPPDTLLNTSLVEVIGYAARVASHDETGELMPYVIQDIFILIAPACFAASIYMTLGRIIRSVNAKHLSPIRTSRLTKTFVGGDLLSFSIQGVAANFFFIPKLAKVGQGIVVAGLFVQLLMFGLFIATTIVFHTRHLRRDTSDSYASKAWRRSLLLLCSVSALIMVRSLFRIVEYIMGQDGYLLGHEWTLYIFDSVPMFLVTVLFYFQEPVNIDPGTDREELRLDARSKP
jgi:RTA1 like protein